jgi:myo-inositol-1(or 4)-monophosphatase
MEKPPIENLEEICHKTVALAQSLALFLLAENQNFSRDSIAYKGFNNLVSYVDEEAERQLVEGCRSIVPEAGFVTEEGTVSAQELASKGLVWIIDPLDGTTNFVHKVPMFSISIALVWNGRPIVGVISHVPNHEMYYAWENGGAWCNGKAIQVSPTSELSHSLLATGFPYFEFEKIENYLSIIHHLMRNSHGLRRMGSAAIDLAYVACGIFEGFFEYNLSPWDVAAGICLVREAGGIVTDFSGADNALFGKQIVAAGPAHPELLSSIQSLW